MELDVLFLFVKSMVYIDISLLHMDVPLVYINVPFSFANNNKVEIRTETRTRPHPRTKKGEELYRFLIFNSRV